jgi:hypothetical protein
MDIGKGKYSWDSYVNSRASVIQETGGDGKVYYYMTYEGSQDTQALCGGGNWGWGVARSTDLMTWTKYPYNPIRQNYQGGCGSDLPYILRINGAITVYQVWDTTNCCPSLPGVRNILLAGSDPYLGVWQALSQCNTWHRIGRADGDGWSANDAQDSPGFLCYGPYIYPGQHLYSTTFIDMIDTCCELFNNPATMTQDIFDDNTGSSVKTTDIYRNDFVLSGQYEGFDWQFSAAASHQYEWRTNWYQKAYIKQQVVFLRQLDDFGILPSQASVTVQLGSTGSLTIGATSWQGFSGTVTLNTSVSPSSGLSVSCPSSLSSTGSGTCNLTGSSSGTYTVTITGSGDGQTHSTMVSVSVAGFALSTNPTSQVIPLGSERQTTMTAASVGGFSGIVNLVMTPSGLRHSPTRLA